MTSKKLIHFTFCVLLLSLLQKAGVQPTGQILWEFWYDISGDNLSNLRNDARFPDKPDESISLGSFDLEPDRGDNYGCRVRGYIYPPADGYYQFWVSGDDNCELLLGTSDNPYTAIKICEVPGWTRQYQWEKYRQQKSSFIMLQGGKKYYIEGLMKEGIGSDTLTGGWGGPVIGEGPEIITKEYLSSWLGWFTAHYPKPADNALLINTWTNLCWSPGKTAVSHDVYLSDNYDNVNEGTSDAFIGNQTHTDISVGFPANPFPGGLIPGKSYYWRVDEVETDGVTKHKGHVWSFSLQPMTAYDPDPKDGAEFVDLNVTLNWTPGLKAKLHTVYFGTDFDEINNASGGCPSGFLTYSPSLLESGKVYYWRVDEFAPPNTFKGDVWSFTTQGAVGNPHPANGAADVAMSTILKWSAAENAVSHLLYFGTNEANIRSANIDSPVYRGSETPMDGNHETGLLEPDTTHYWRVDKVDAQGNTSKGPIWTFTTGSHLLIDNFEGYNDDSTSGEAIWQKWIDGSSIAENGAQVGFYLPPYIKQKIAHGGSQCMPLLYFNEDGVTNSEAALTLTAPRDWTIAGVGELSLWIRGDVANAAEPLYVAISNTTGAQATKAHDDPAIATNGIWKQWRISLQVFADQGINLTDVDKISIGLGNKGGAAVGGTGTIYIDDIRLY